MREITDRDVFGWLGKIPDCIMKGSTQEAMSYKKLADEAHEVAMMRNTEAKVRRAKQIQMNYYQLIGLVERRLDEAGIPYKRTERPPKETY